MSQKKVEAYKEYKRNNRDLLCICRVVRLFYL